jgi:hypothetical protein
LFDFVEWICGPAARHDLFVRGQARIEVLVQREEPPIRMVHILRSAPAGFTLLTVEVERVLIRVEEHEQATLLAEGTDAKPVVPFHVVPCAAFPALRYADG